MNGWGRVWCLGLLGLSIAAGCGGRTDAFDDYYDEDTAGSSLGAAGSVSTAGKSGKGGSSATAGASVGGKSSVGGKGTAGKGTAGKPNGTAGVGGAISTGGVAGVAGFGGSLPLAGFGGALPIGGIGGIAGFGGEPASCQNCLVDSCGAEFLQCLQDVGCVAIILCAQNSNCQGLDCYTAGACKGVIDNYGGPAGPSMNELLKTLGCAVNAGCACN